MEIMGLDVGSRAAKSALLVGRKWSWGVADTTAWRDLLSSGTEVVATGYFRKKVPHTLEVTEITAAIHGVRHFIRGDVDAIVDIGAQDTKVIDLATGEFMMNDKCSAGTGAFLEFLASYFGLGMEELQEYHFRAGRTAEINNTCAVFAQSEVVSRLVEGYTREEVIKGIHHAFARRIGQLIPPDADRVAFIGGVVKNKGVVDAFEKELGIRALVPREPQVVNAVGALEYYISRSGRSPKS